VGLSNQGQFLAQLSIIVPVTRMHGRLAGLKKWISEINYGETQVILVHDFQDELTSLDLRLLIDEFPAIQLIEQTFMSAGLARNAGLKAAQADWILFWDSDDEPNISVLMEFLKLPNKLNFDLFVFNFRIDNDSNISNIQTNSWKELAVHPGLWRIIFSRSTVSGHVFPSFPLGEDQLYLAQLDLPSCRIGFIDAYLYTYKVNVNGQATSSYSNLLRLKESLLDLNSIRARQKGDNFEFTSILYWRQILTLLKRGNASLKLQAISLILGNVLKLNSNYVINFRALNYLLRKLVIQRG
jgi:glycosyltransferase involved in cell wall biosynthesis